MAIDDNTVYGLTGAQVKELPGKIEAVKGLARELTADDYNWPANSPTRIATWLLPAGIYKTKVATLTNTQKTFAQSTSYKTFVVFEGSDYDIITMFLMPGSSDSVGWSGSTLAMYDTNKNDGSIRTQYTGQVLYDTRIVDNLTSTSTGSVLSAAQGKALKDLIDAIVTPDVFTTNGWNALWA